VCQFMQKCINCDAVVDYTEYEMCCVGEWKTLKIQLDLVGYKNQDMTLEQMLRFIEAKGAGKRLATQFLLPHATDTITGSAYKHQKRDIVERPLPKE